MSIRLNRLAIPGSDVRLPLCGCLIASLVSLRYVWLPGAWICLWLTLLCCWIAWRRRRVRFLFVNAAVALATLGACEAWFSRSVWHDSSYTVEGHPDADYYVSDPVLGGAPRPNTRIIHTKHGTDGSEIFRCAYTIDERGLRVTPQTDSAPAIAFFGCSFTFGEGVEDESAMPYRVGVLQPAYQAYNFAFHGYGPHQMLAAIESGRMEQLITAPPRFVIYQMIPNHVPRVAGRVRWLRHAPAYGLVEGQVRLLGHFDDFPLSSKFRSLMQKSALYTQLIEPRLTTDADVELTVAIVNRARTLIADKFPGCEFHVLLWDDAQSWLSQELVESLHRSSLEAHLMSDILPEYSDRDRRYKIPGDKHPNAAAHDLVARYVSARIIEASAGNPE
jgi:hypothetical protein